MKDREANQRRVAETDCGTIHQCGKGELVLQRLDRAEHALVGDAVATKAAKQCTGMKGAIVIQ